uniref:Uncharacterized protein n=1 Tax=Bombyx mori TaxID=7091 RepID=A0A8R2DLK4_BOMMO|nr:uncharacterized protein LOC110385015 [Bombyx mori]
MTGRPCLSVSGAVKCCCCVRFHCVFYSFVVFKLLFTMPKVVKSAGREIILKVKEFCEAEQKNQGVLIPINNVRKRVAVMTDVSEKTVSRITQEGKVALCQQCANKVPVCSVQKCG